MIEWIPHDDRCRVPPEVARHVVRAMKFPTSRSVAETSGYVTVDYVPVGMVFRVTLYHFMKVGSGWMPCTWEDLSDEHRLAIRTGEYRNRRYEIGEYEDSRYYVLEALT